MTLLLVSEIYSVSYCSLLFPLIFIYFALIISFRPLVVLFNILPTMRQFKKKQIVKGACWERDSFSRLFDLLNLLFLTI